jgi:hypothetical protein
MKQMDSVRRAAAMIEGKGRLVITVGARSAEDADAGLGHGLTILIDD